VGKQRNNLHFRIIGQSRVVVQLNFKIFNMFIVVLCTTPKNKGYEIAKKIIENKLAACVNIVNGINSIYWWKGEINEDEEELLVIKTKKTILNELITFIKSIHPYSVPEIIALDIIDGNIDYLNWIEENVK
jgi:periplasmic divalent cation tolerance protein